ncbi:hypothetical protein B0H67DRAFT_644241 [Lasiosphaeris hirsuta]|uniref:Methyltransferase n=1 Tax=Lasiosphaeris hirsuta TaxID=260670 RepID=A0AA40ASA6_9PEZI|nr:hypothetical protein B0H67DRAFT_644241 [Lasiosphaeris hirsuta]
MSIPDSISPALYKIHVVSATPPRPGHQIAFRGAHVADPDAAPRPELSVDDAFVPIDPNLHAATSGFRTPAGSANPDPDSIEEDGRLYHGYTFGSRWFCGSKVKSRIDLTSSNSVMGMILKDQLALALALALIQNPRNVLDIATGTGI